MGHWARARVIHVIYSRNSTDDLNPPIELDRPTGIAVIGMPLLPQPVSFHVDMGWRIHMAWS